MATRVYLATGDRFGALADLEADRAPAWALEGSGVQCLAVDPRDRDTVYVGCRGGGLRRTRDGGETWQELELPEPDASRWRCGRPTAPSTQAPSPAGCSQP